MKTALIFGISGQDGSCLAELLLKKGYHVHGTSRDVDSRSFSNLQRLGIADRVSLHSASLVDFRNLLQVITQVEPDEIYNLAGQTSVGLSFSQPMETMESVALGSLQILEVMRYLHAPIRLYNAGSSECFGAGSEGPSNEATPFRPCSPYAAAKAAAFWATANYREAYGLHACSGILFNHESPLRPARFVTRKIVSAACRIAAGSKEILRLGNMEIRRDWGWAPEYADAMWRMLQRESPEDFVIATGESHTLEEFVALTFETVGLDWRKHVEVDRSLYRPSDLMFSEGDPSRAAEVLGWKAEVHFRELVRRLVEAERTVNSVGKVESNGSVN